MHRALPVLEVAVAALALAAPAPAATIRVAVTSFADPRVTYATRPTCGAHSPDFRAWWRDCGAGRRLAGTRPPFHVVARTRDRLVARRGTTTILFLRLDATAAEEAFRDGRVDEAPVAVGGLAAARSAWPVRVTQLRGVDLLDFGGALADLPALRRAYFDTADRGTYRQVVAEDAAPTTVSLLHPGGDVTPAEFRRAKSDLLGLPRVRVPIQLPRDPAERYAATFLYGAWRNVQLGPELVARSRIRFRRVIAPYDSPEALVYAVAPRLARPVVGDRAALQRLDERLRREALVVPVAGVADARLVSRCLRGWHEDRLGRVDYTRVRRRC